MDGLIAHTVEYVFSTAFLKGAAMTVLLSMLSIVAGMVLGLPLALLQSIPSKPVRWAVAAYLWVVRGTPVLLQLILAFNVLPLAGIVLPGFMCAVLVLSINESAYMAEIFRSGISSVGKGQRMAAKALGLRDSQVFWDVVFPQAARVIVPPLGNQFIGMLKLSSIVSVIAVEELLLVANQAAGESFRYLEALTAAAVYYLLLTSFLMVIQARIEAWAGRKKRTRPSAAGVTAELVSIAADGRMR